MSETKTILFKCPKCEDGIAGEDYYGEAIECHYCDQRGQVSTEHFVDRMDAFMANVGDLQAADHRIATLEAENARLKECSVMFNHAIEQVDRVFQVESGKPAPLLPDFLGLGESKFEGVVKLATAYLSLEGEVARLTRERDEALQVDDRDVGSVIEAALENGAYRLRTPSGQISTKIFFRHKSEMEASDELTTLRQSHGKLREAAEAALANMEHYGDNEPRDEEVKARLRSALQPIPPQGASE